MLTRSLDFGTNRVCAMLLFNVYDDVASGTRGLSLGPIVHLQLYIENTR